MASTGTRLRKTFKYPSDSESSTGSRDELDEEGKHLLSGFEAFVFGDTLRKNDLMFPKLLCAETHSLLFRLPTMIP